MSGNALATVEDFDRSAGDAHIDLYTDQRIWHRVKIERGFDVIIRRDACQTPFGEFVIALRQRSQCRLLHAFEKIAAAKPKAPHDVTVHALERLFNRPIGFFQREERLMPQPSENVSLCEADSGFDFRLVARPVRARRQDAHAVMRGHHGVAAIDLWLVERRLVHTALEIVWNYDTRHAAEEPEHAHMCSDPVRE